MSQSAHVRLVYKTPSLEGLEGVDPADEFENLDDLIGRAGLDDLQAVLNKAMIYYLYMLDAHESDRVLLGRPYDGPRGFVLDDQECGNYHQADVKELDMETGTLEQIRNRAGLESVDNLLERGLILFEKVIQAREAGWGICLYDPQSGATQWLIEDQKTDATISATPRHGPGKPTLQ